MKKIFFLLFAILISGCSATKLKKTDPANISMGPDEVKGSMALPKEGHEPNIENTSTKSKSFADLGEFSDSSGVRKIISFLAADDLQGRDTGSEGIDKAANLIEYTFKENGITPYFSSYKDTLTNIQETAYNVVGFLEGTDSKLKNEFVIVGAHYDHIGTAQPVGQDSIANGANDNASGTTTVMEIARYFGSKKSNKRSIIFALFSAEERGLLGSAHLAKKLKSQNIDLYTMLNFEMVGVPLRNKDYFMYISGYEMSNMAEVANQYVGDKLIGFLPTAAKMNLFQRSDNYPFHLQFNVPSQTFCTFDFTNFDHYHKVGDETEIMDFEHMAEVVNRVIPAVQGIVNATTKEIKYN